MLLKIKRWSGHEYTCWDCNETWKQHDWFHLWPIKLGWQNSKHIGKEFITSWGWQTDILKGKNTGDRQFGQTLRLGRVLVKLGPTKSTPYNREKYIANLKKIVKHFDCQHVGIKHVGCEHLDEEK